MPAVKKFLLTIGFTLAGFLASFAEAQVITLTIDSTQSSADVFLAGSSSSSTLSGTITLDLEVSDPPSGSVQVTDLDLVLDDALNFNILIFVGASTSPGGVNISMVTPGAPGTIADGSFDQLSSLLMFEGGIDVQDPFGLAGGNQTVDLSTIELDPFDFNAINVTRSGDVITISNSATISETLDLGGTGIPIEVDVTYVATGVAPEMKPAIKGDVDRSGVVDFLDIAPFIAALSDVGFQVEADTNCDLVVDFLDIQPFIDILSGNSPNQ